MPFGPQIPDAKVLWTAFEHLAGESERLQAFGHDQLDGSRHRAASREGSRDQLFNEAQGVRHRAGA
jgi:hypothetical protein